ncbi:MAG TPA: tRNA (N6-isopentenyl adenosine(37)-C2)-methylthiotransferase MiaB [Vicinamibacteria bacterium]|nr:tRNA (N6-isopentenyl adenosine(37)-C2)-methylthiotransferase MiaB [Vicinamibacteria bacterium]
MKFFIETFGCQMNVNDSEKVSGLLQAEGHEPVAEAGEADFVFVNTCAVREKASEKLFHALGRLKQLKRRRPDLMIGAGGCVTQLQGAASILARAPYVDVIAGARNVARVPELLRQARDTARAATDLDRRADSFAVPVSSVAHSSPVRAYVTVMEGCNHVCSFCVVPRTRGTEACRAPEEVLAEVESLVGRGYKEVMLLGQTVNAYAHGGADFAELLRRVDAVDGLTRLRFTTSHPEHVGPRLADALRDLPRVCPYLHLPVQSGSDRVLSSMRRGYTRGEYLDKVALLRDRVPDLALSSDVIVGYPGETDDDFQATVDLVEAVGFDGLFVFTYSPRPGTSALRLGDGVPEAEKARRLQVLNQAQQRRQAGRNARRVGKSETVLVDAVAGPGRLSGRTPHFRIAHLDGPPSWLGRLLTVEVTGSGANSLTGRVLANNSLTAVSSLPIF